LDVTLFEGHFQALAKLPPAADHFVHFLLLLLVLVLQQTDFDVELALLGPENLHLVPDQLRRFLLEFIVKDRFVFALDLGDKTGDGRPVLQGLAVGIAIITGGLLIAQAGQDVVFFNSLPFADKEFVQDAAFQVLDFLDALRGNDPAKAACDFIKHGHLGPDHEQDHQQQDGRGHDVGEAPAFAVHGLIHFAHEQECFSIVFLAHDDLYRETLILPDRSPSSTACFGPSTTIFPRSMMTSLSTRSSMEWRWVMTMSVLPSM